MNVGAMWIVSWLIERRSADRLLATSRRDQALWSRYASAELRVSPDCLLLNVTASEYHLFSSPTSATTTSSTSISAPISAIR